MRRSEGQVFSVSGRREQANCISFIDSETEIAAKISSFTHFHAENFSISMERLTVQGTL